MEKESLRSRLEPRKCESCAVRDICLPGPLNDDELSAFSRIITRTKVFHKGDYLYRVGSRFDGFYAVYSGHFKKFSTTQKGTEQVVGISFPGEIMGLHAIHSGEHQFNAVALNTALACHIPYRAYQQLVVQFQKLDNHVYRLLSLELMKARFLAADLSAIQKVATLLLLMSHRFAERGYAWEEYLLPMSNSDIASMLRLATETVSRVFTRLADGKIASVDHRHVRILDVERLSAMCPQDLTQVDDRSARQSGKAFRYVASGYAGWKFD